MSVLVYLNSLTFSISHYFLCVAEMIDIDKLKNWLEIFEMKELNHECSLIQTV